MRLTSSKRRKFRFPWRNGNCFRLHIDGAAFYPAMLKAIDTATEQILLEMYLFESGVTANTFIEAFIRAAARQVQVYILLDDFGASGFKNSDRDRLAHPNIHISLYNPLTFGNIRHNLFRDHRKLLIADGKTAFTGGAGITDSFDTKSNPKGSWHDIMIEIEGPCCKDWKWLFVENWNSSNSHKLPFPGNPERSKPGSQRGRLVFNQTSNLEIRRSFLQRVGIAKERVWITTAYFAPTWKVRRALRKAVHRGVDVRILLPGPHSDHATIRHAGRRFYVSLLRNGVRLFEYQPRFVHAKILLCDDWVSIGSCNIERWTQGWNLEANQEVDDLDFCEQVTEMFMEDFAQSAERSHRDWANRPWYQRLWESVLRRLDLWIEHIKHRR